MEVLVFGGTVEGRQLVEWLDARGSCDIVACTATAYGASLVAGGRHVTVLEGPLSGSDKQRLVTERDFACIIDATHPYAVHISESIAALAESTGLELVRIVREGAAEGPWVSVSSSAEAAEHLAATEGNILLTTGSKDLDVFIAALPNYRERLYVRVLPVTAALEKASDLGIPASHIIAMQGPFSAELNCALIKDLQIRHLVTKQSGPAGGFDEKVQAARACGIELVVIERPCVEEGVSLEQAQALLEERYGL